MALTAAFLVTVRAQAAPASALPVHPSPGQGFAAVLKDVRPAPVPPPAMRARLGEAAWPLPLPASQAGLTPQQAASSMQSAWRIGEGAVPPASGQPDQVPSVIAANTGSVQASVDLPAPARPGSAGEPAVPAHVPAQKKTGPLSPAGQQNPATQPTMLPAYAALAALAPVIVPAPAPPPVPILAHATLSGQASPADGETPEAVSSAASSSAGASRHAPARVPPQSAPLAMAPAGTGNDAAPASGPASYAQATQQGARPSPATGGKIQPGTQSQNGQPGQGLAAEPATVRETLNAPPVALAGAGLPSAAPVLQAGAIAPVRPASGTNSAAVTSPGHHTPAAPAAQAGGTPLPASVMSGAGRETGSPAAAPVSQSPFQAANGGTDAAPARPAPSRSSRPDGPSASPAPLSQAAEAALASPVQSSADPALTQAVPAEAAAPHATPAHETGLTPAPGTAHAPSALSPGQSPVAPATEPVQSVPAMPPSPSDEALPAPPLGNAASMAPAEQAVAMNGAQMPGHTATARPGARNAAAPATATRSGADPASDGTAATPETRDPTQLPHATAASTPVAGATTQAEPGNGARQPDVQQAAGAAETERRPKADASAMPVRPGKPGPTALTATFADVPAKGGMADPGLAAAAPAQPDSVGTSTSIGPAQPLAGGTDLKPAHTAEQAGAPAATPAAQLAQAVTSLHVGADGSSHVTIKLDPVELGQLQIRITRAPDGTASVNVAVERPQTLASLQGDLGHLHQALDRAGLPEQRSISLHLAGTDQASSQSFGSGTGGMSQGGFQQGARQERQPGSAFLSDTAGSQILPAMIDLAAPARQTPRSGVNITA